MTVENDGPDNVLITVKYDSRYGTGATVSKAKLEQVLMSKKAVIEIGGPTLLRIIRKIGDGRRIPTTLWFYFKPVENSYNLCVICEQDLKDALKACS